MKLSEKQKRFADEYLIDLNRAYAIFRFFNPSSVFDAKTQSYLVFNAILVLISDAIIDYYRKKAALLILKYFIPDWRDLLGAQWGPIDRDDPRVREWKKNVLDRDGYKCRICESNFELEVHHILSWSEFPTYRIDINNGITLCNPCHADMHIQEKQLILHRSGKVRSP